MTSLPGFHDSVTFDPVQDQIDLLNQQFSIQKSLDIVAFGDLTVSWNGSPTGAAPAVATYAHGLGYVPTFLAFYENATYPGQRFPVPWMNFNVSTGTITNRFMAYTDTTNLTITYQSWITDYAQTYTIYYYLFRQPAKVS